VVLLPELDGKARVDSNSGEITVIVPLDESEEEKLERCFTTSEAKAKVKGLVALVREAEVAFGGTGKTRRPSPYEQQLAFSVPGLCVREARCCLNLRVRSCSNTLGN